MCYHCFAVAATDTTVCARIQVDGSIFRLVRIHRMGARACYRPLERRTAACALPRMYPPFFPSPTPLRKEPCTGSRLKRLSGHEGWESRRTRLSPYPCHSSSLHYSVTCTAISCGSSFNTLKRLLSWREPRCKIAPAGYNQCINVAALSKKSSRPP